MAGRPCHCLRYLFLRNPATISHIASVKGGIDMLIQRASDIPSSEITPEKLFHGRREFIKHASAVLGIAAAGTLIPGSASAFGAVASLQAKGKYDTTEKATPFE